MTISQRKRPYQPDEIQTVNEPGLQIECDACDCDLTHSIRIKCADPICEEAGDVDICPGCFCAGKEFKQHKRTHVYRVIELHSYPIFEESWGADEELLLLEGISLMGFGNWKRIAEHIGTRTKEEVQQHYNQVYTKSPDWPLPVMNKTFNIPPDEFQERKRRRIAAMNAVTTTLPAIAPTSTPAIHEVGTFLPGRLEFEHELDNEAETIVKDLEMGICPFWGGDEIPEDEDDPDVKARLKWEEEKAALAQTRLHPLDSSSDVKMNGHGTPAVNGFGPPPAMNGKTPHAINGEAVVKTEPSLDKPKADGSKEEEEEEAVDDAMQPPPIETADSLKFKITLLEMYMQRVDKRHEAKAIMFDRGLLEYKKVKWFILPCILLL
jgi:transcriptional adapter 2-alpha